MRELWKSPEAAERLKLSDSTLRKWRVSGQGPRFIKIGGRVLYDPADVQSWMDQRRRNSTSQQAAA